MATDDRINSTFDHRSQDLLNKSVDRHGTISKSKRQSYRVANRYFSTLPAIDMGVYRKYTRSGKISGSESRVQKKLNRQNTGSRNNMTIDHAENSNFETVKIPRSSLKLYSKPNFKSGSNTRNIPNNLRKLGDRRSTRPILKNMPCNNGNNTIKLDNKFYQKLNDCKIMDYSDLDICDSKLSFYHVPSNNEQNAPEQLTRNDSYVQPQQPKLIDFSHFKLNISRRGSFKRDGSNMSRGSNKKLTLKKQNGKTWRPFSMSRIKHNTKNQRLVVSKTIEHHDRTMDEYTNASIPEFTLGPEGGFEDKELQVKNLSVSRMGFYED